MARKKAKWVRRQSLTFRLSISILTCVFFGGICLLLSLSQYSKPIIKSYIDSQAQQSLQELVTTLSSIGLETEAATLTMKNTLKEINDTDVDMIRNILNSAVQTLEYDQSDSSHAWI